MGLGRLFGVGTILAGTFFVGAYCQKFEKCPQINPYLDSVSRLCDSFGKEEPSQEVPLSQRQYLFGEIPQEEQTPTLWDDIKDSIGWKEESEQIPQQVPLMKRKYLFGTPEEQSVQEPKFRRNRLIH